jgi:hypothetical protein
MIEGLFVITTIFVSYVVYQIVNEPKTTDTSEEAHAVVETPVAPEQAPAIVEAPAAAVAEETAVAPESVEEVPAAAEAPEAAVVEETAAAPESVEEVPAAAEAPEAAVVEETAAAPESVEEVPAAAEAPEAAVVEETAVAPESVEEVPTAAETPVAEIVEAKAAPSTEQSPPKAAGIKNPKTGEVVIVYNNYRFAKRWIKEALVAEGLLKKIYKNNELNADVEAKIKAALVTLESMDKYHV